MPFVYRAYSRDGVLLYVGRARSWARRWANHEHQSPELFATTYRLEVERFSSLSDAQRREARLIADTKPLWNRRHESEPDPTFRCELCRCYYDHIQTESEWVRWHGRIIWSVAGYCNDMKSGWPCLGKVVPAESSP